MPNTFIYHLLVLTLTSIQCNQHRGQISTTHVLVVHRNDWCTLNGNPWLFRFVPTLNCWHWLDTSIIWTKLRNFIIDPFCNNHTWVWITSVIQRTLTCLFETLIRQHWTIANAICSNGSSSMDIFQLEVFK